MEKLSLPACAACLGPGQGRESHLQNDFPFLVQRKRKLNSIA